MQEKKKKLITVPPKEEHCINGVYYRSGDTYFVEVDIKEKKLTTKEPDNGTKTTG